MYVDISLHLYLKPEMMLSSYTGPLHEQLREHAQDMSQWLTQAADYLTRMHAAGWQFDLLLYDVACSHAEVATKEQAIERLRALEIEPKHFCIEEIEDGE